jgi:hypothetical protein
MVGREIYGIGIGSGADLSRILGNAGLSPCRVALVTLITSGQGDRLAPSPRGVRQPM